VAFDLISRNRDHLSQFGDVTSRNYTTYEQMLNSIILPRNPFRLRFGIRNAEGTYVGSINLTPTVENREIGEIGYYIGREFEGQGYTTAAVNALTDYAFENLGYQELFGSVVDGNDGSLRVLEKAGYTERERITINDTAHIQLYKVKPV
jgi:RimJ/RimL family protein N-acetyltransferase